MYACILDHRGETVLHRNRKASPDALLKAIVPHRDDLGIAVACVVTWSWLADRCAREGTPFVPGHALCMKASHGGKATHDKIDAHKIAALLRGGMLPQACVYPAEGRATRDLLRRRRGLTRKRAELLPPVPQTNSQHNLPEVGQEGAYKVHREGVAARAPEPAVQKSLAVDLARIDSSDQPLRDRELHLVTAAQHHGAKTLHLLRTAPGIGNILSPVRLYESHDLRRFPRGQAFVSYCRSVKCAKESAGKRYGTSGAESGNADPKWALCEAAVLCLRNSPAAQTYLARLEKRPGKGQALTALAHRVARAIYRMLKRETAFDLDEFFTA